MMRAVTSDAPPGGYGMTKRIGLIGYVCAIAVVQVNIVQARTIGLAPLRNRIATPPHPAAPGRGEVILNPLSLFGSKTLDPRSRAGTWHLSGMTAYSTFAPDCRTSFPHFSCSDRTKRPSSSGVL